MRSGRWLIAVVCSGVAIAVACGGGNGPGGGTPPPVGNGGGTVTDGGTDDAGTPDGGSDAGTDGGTDGGVTNVVPPTLSGWKFYATAEGLPPGNVMGASMDEGGTLWVAGGTAGVLALKPGATSFQKFGIADGLHPYGYLNGDTAAYFKVPDGSPADLHPSLNDTPAISISGGPADTAFVGYQGKPGCEDAWTWQCEAKTCDMWDPNNPSKCLRYICVQGSDPSTWGDPSVYKSGDADRVTLTGSGITVGHYDIFSGPKVVHDEQGGREKLCSIQRILYQHGSKHLWFGGNHGFAVGDATNVPAPTCNGQFSCGVLEHVHPAFNDSAGHYVTDGYLGIAVDRLGSGPDRNVWFGGETRSTLFKFGDTGGNYFTAESLTEDAPYWRNRIDVWPDPVGEVDANGNPTYPTPAQWGGPTIDLVSGMASMSDGSLWIGSNGHGLRHLTHDGSFIEDFVAQGNSVPLSKQLIANNVSALAGDTDDTLWVGYRWGGGFSHVDPKKGTATHYSWRELGDLANSVVSDIQVVTIPKRAVIVSFQDGAVAVFAP